MKPKLLLTALMAVLLITGQSCNKRGKNDLPADVIMNPNTASGKVDPNALPVIEFETDFHDFGKLMSGEKVTYSFKFKNKGKGMLLISKVSTSCGCTISEYPKEPLKSGAEGTIDVSFDSEGRIGLQNKTITVFSNTQPSTTMLRIQASVVDVKDM
ncbi:MAG TPA: DUF1573 domain-containing protein [Bacteroidales bacterium]|nr:DUF1573 domain-containing protein [Bacteroidales bacterium]HPT01129.1 DUF1573 domain-containing protein [Bacteroidales bacterium]